MELFKINESDFYHLLTDTHTFIVDFSANWCSDCIYTDKILTEFAAENPDLRVYQLDVDESTDVANRYGVINVPSLLVFENSKVKSKAEGKLTKEELSELIV